MSITRSWKVYGEEGHRQHESFFKSYEIDCSEKGFARIVKIENSDKTGTNEYSVIHITRNTAQECQEELDGQLSDGAFENSKVGKVVEITENAGNAHPAVMITPCDVAIKRYYRMYVETKEGATQDDIIKKAEKDILLLQDQAMDLDPELEIEEGDIVHICPDMEGQWAEEVSGEIKKILTKNDPSDEISISRIAYELYKEKWIYDHTIQSERLQVTREYWAYYMECKAKNQEVDPFDLWLARNGGYNGCLYSSFEEFSCEEYEDDHFITLLLKNESLIKLYHEERNTVLKNEIKNILAQSIGEDYLPKILEKCLEDIVHDVEVSSDYLGGGTWDDSDIRLAVGRVLEKHLGIEA